MSIIKLKDLILLKEYETRTRAQKLDNIADVDIDYFIKNYSDAYYAYKEKNNILFRGSNSDIGSYAYIDPKSKERVAKDTSNVYTALISTLPSWHNYPKRSYSIIFSTSYESAISYGGDVYVVFLMNGSKLAMCKTSDCYGSFSHIEKRFELVGYADVLEKFSYVVSRLTDQSLLRYSYPKIDNLEEFYNNLSLLSWNNIVDGLRNARSVAQGFVEKFKSDLEANLKLINGRYDWKEYFDNLLDPVKNEISLYDTSDLRSIEVNHTKKEGWSDGEAILVISPRVDDIIKLVDNRVKGNYTYDKA